MADDVSNFRALDGIPDAGLAAGLAALSGVISNIAPFHMIDDYYNALGIQNPNVGGFDGGDDLFKLSNGSVVTPNYDPATGKLVNAGVTFASLQTDKLTFDTGTGEVSEDAEFNAAGVQTDQIFINVNGNLAKVVVFNSDSSTVETDFGAPDANGNQAQQSIIARDASGNITDDKELQSDGSTIETQFSNGAKTNEIVTDANGDLSETIAFNPDGSTLEKDFSAPDANGDQVAQSIIARDASGNITDDKELQSDGSTIETQFSNGVESNQIFTDANGDLTKTIAFNADDSQTISTFDAQGHVTLTQDINASGTLVSAVARDDAGNVISDKELQGDGTYIETQFDNGAATAQIFSDADGNLSKIIDFNDDGSTTVRTFNDQGDVSLTENFDPNGNFVSADGTSAAGVAFSQVGQGVEATFTFGNIPLDFSDAAVSGGEALGSAIGKALGGNNLALEIGGATILGTVSKNLAASLVTLAGFTTNAGMPSPLSGLLNDALNNTFSDLGIQLPSTLSGLGGELGNVGVGQISSLLTSEVANALGLKGFGAGLFDAVGTTITSTIINNTFGALKVALAGGSEANIGNALVQGFNITDFGGGIGGSVGGCAR